MHEDTRTQNRIDITITRNGKVTKLFAVTADICPAYAFMPMAEVLSSKLLRDCRSLLEAEKLAPMFEIPDGDASAFTTDAWKDNA